MCVYSSQAEARTEGEILLCDVDDFWLWPHAPSGAFLCHEWSRLRPIMLAPLRAGTGVPA